MKISGLITLANLFWVVCCAQKNNISLADELHGFSVPASLPEYRTHTIVEQESTYDRSGYNDDGFNGTYSFVRRNADSSLVMIDINGPGVINRIATPTPNEDTLDIYIDDTVRPAISICYMDLFSGKVFPFVSPLSDQGAGGYYCYFPILFQRHCKIVSRGKHLQFHQLQYRLFPPGTKIQSFTKAIDEEGKEALAAIGVLWNQSPKKPEDFVVNANSLQQAEKKISLSAGETGTIFQMTTGARITGIELSPATAFEGLNHTRIRMWWDKEKEPAVDCPVSDFFGYGLGKPSMRSVLIGSENAHAYCYIPMPFDKAAKIELVNDSAEKTDVTAHVFYTLQKRMPEREGKFYAQYEKQLVPQNQKHVLLDIAGKGHYIGTILKAKGVKPGIPEFFEGDDSTATDGVFRIHGTGSEDYFNGGWYDLPGRWDSARSLPLSGCIEYAKALGRSAGYRFYLNDKLSFEKSIYQAIEHGPTIQGIPAVYTSISFYYCDRSVLQQRPNKKSGMSTH